MQRKKRAGGEEMEELAGCWEEEEEGKEGGERKKKSREISDADQLVALPYRLRNNKRTSLFGRSISHGQERIDLLFFWCRERTTFVRTTPLVTSSG